MAQTFLEQLDREILERLAILDTLKEDEIPAEGGREVVRRLKMALKNELEASELAALWMATTPEIDVKLALARQAGDEAKHYRLIEKRLNGMGVDVSGFNPASDGYGPMFQLLVGFESTVEREAAQLTREALALKKNQQFIEFCDSVSDPETADLYRREIQPDEEWHVNVGRQVLERYAVTPELQEKAREAVRAVLELAVKIQNRQLKELKVSHAPGC